MCTCVCLLSQVCHKTLLFVFISYHKTDLVSLFNSISTFKGYLMSESSL